jgi:hypothetical protein
MKSNARQYIGVAIKGLLKKIWNRILLNFIRLWNSTSKSIILNEKAKLSTLTKILRGGVLNQYNFQVFQEKLKKSASSNQFVKNIKKVVKSFDNKDKIGLAYYFKKLQITSIKLSNLKNLQILRDKFLNNTVINRNMKNSHNNLAIAFNVWRTLTFNKDHNLILKNINEVKFDVK